MSRAHIDAAAARVEAAELVDRCTITRADATTQTVDQATFVTSYTTATIATDVQCLVTAARPRREADSGDDRESVADHRIRLPRGTSIQPGDLIMVTSSETGTLIGATFDVIGTVGRSTEVTKNVWARIHNPDPQA